MENNPCLPAWQAVKYLAQALLEVIPGETPVCPRRTGKLTISAGTQTIRVPLKPAPTIVYTALQSFGGSHCGGNSGADLATAVPTPEGFTLFTNISSDSATVEWIAL